MPCDTGWFRVTAHVQGTSGILTLTEYGDLIVSNFVITQVVDDTCVELAEE